MFICHRFNWTDANVRNNANWSVSFPADVLCFVMISHVLLMTSKIDDPETDAAKWNGAIVDFMINICAFPTVACQKCAQWKRVVGPVLINITKYNLHSFKAIWLVNQRKNKHVFQAKSPKLFNYDEI